MGGNIRILIFSLVVFGSGLSQSGFATLLEMHLLHVRPTLYSLNTQVAAAGKKGRDEVPKPASKKRCAYLPTT